MRVLRDTGVLGQLCHPKDIQSRPLASWLAGILDRREWDVIIPEIADYELRRKLLHLARVSGQSTSKSMIRLDRLTETLTYLPLGTETMRKAADLWAEARATGAPTAPPDALDGDVLLAAQALLVSGLVVTKNRKHLSRYVAVSTWEDLASSA